MNGLLRHIWDRALALEAGVVSAINSRVDQRVSLIVGSVLIVIGIGELTEPIHVRVAFYAAVTQIIPVLMLVAAVEGRYFRNRAEDATYDRFIQRGFWYSGLAGIGASLVVLARGGDSVLLRGAVIYSLALIGVLVSVYAIYGPAGGEESGDSEGDAP